MLEGYSDSNQISDVVDLYVTSGYVLTLGDVVVSWTSCKKNYFDEVNNGSITYCFGDGYYRDRMNVCALVGLASCQKSNTSYPYEQ